MAFIVRSTFAFEGLGQGFSESFYWSKSTKVLADAEDSITEIAKKRAKLLASAYVLTVCRNTIVEEVGVGRIKRLSDIFEPRLPGVAAWTANAQPNEALMCLWQTGDNNYSKKQYMRGCPSGLTDDGKKPVIGYASWLSSFNAWREAMVAQKAGWLTSVVDQQRPISTYLTIADSGIVKFTFGEGGFTWPVPFGTRTRIYVKLPGRSPLDGPLVVVPTSPTVAITAEPVGVAPQIPDQIGSAEIRKYQLVTLESAGQGAPVGQIHPQRMVTHKTGRPTYASRGRSAGRARGLRGTTPAGRWSISATPRIGRTRGCTKAVRYSRSNGTKRYRPRRVCPTRPQSAT
jgi:hypothetical protein